jgi:hypothetical protein
MRQKLRHHSKIVVVFLAVFVLLTPAAAQARKSKIALIDAFVTAKRKYHNFNGNFLIA